MRDFEVVGGEKVARGQGICCFFVHELTRYVKLIYDKKEGVKALDYAYPKDIEQFEKGLNHDLSIGYSYFIIKENGQKVLHMCEKRDERDEQKLSLFLIWSL